ncbi:angel2 [Symbiodinium natans]|uniref:Angel2 protein n=1 Tax=Symbiodinium natans TaxID=878477 RepID=A0A812UZK2_9DINO|nr:angel2 [Symbiodinium natans]
MDGNVYRGVLRSFSLKDGYGFVRCSELLETFGRDVYCPVSLLPNGICCGARVVFTLAINDRGQPRCGELLEEDTSSIDALSPLELLPLDLNLEPCCEAILESLGTCSARIVSWNLLAPSYCSGAFFKDVDPEALRWPRRATQIKTVLHALAPTILCLQEIELDRPLEELGLSSYAVASVQRPKRSNGLDRKDGCLIAWQREAFTLIRQQPLYYDDFPPPQTSCQQDDGPSGHVALLVELQPTDAPEGWTVLIATTHLAWNDTREDLRTHQASVLLQTVLSYRNDYTIICGDFNMTPQSPTHGLVSQFFSSAYQDIERLSGESGGVTTTNALARSGQGFAEIIDYCWLRASEGYWGPWAHRRLRLPCRAWLRSFYGTTPQAPLPTLLHSGRWPSDHFPIAVDVVFWTEPGHAATPAAR